MRRKMGAAPGQGPKRGKIVLIADDHRNIRNILAFHLEKDGFEVVAVGDGEAALQELRGRKVDLVLLDSAMPRIDGVTLCRMIKEDPATQGIPVVFSTGRTDKQHVLDAVEAGAVDYLVKPYGAKLLLEKVRKVLNLSAPDGEEGGGARG